MAAAYVKDDSQFHQETSSNVKYNKPCDFFKLKKFNPNKNHCGSNNDSQGAVRGLTTRLNRFYSFLIKLFPLLLFFCIGESWLF
jgi:hypothetical protein